jgi:hypothetical protein
MKTSQSSNNKKSRPARKISREKNYQKDPSAQLIHSRLIPDELNEEILLFMNSREIIDEEEEIYPDSHYDFI